MKATLNLAQGVRLICQAVAGEVILQIHRPGSVCPVTTATMPATTAGAFLDMLSGVACVAEEQAFDLDLQVALAVAGHAPPPRDLADTHQPEPVASARHGYPNWVRHG